MDNDKTPLFAYAGSDCASRASPARALLLLASVLAVAATVLTVAVTTAAPPTADLITAPMPKKDLRHWILDDLSAEETRAVASYVLARRPGTRASLYGGQSGDYSDYISGTSSVELILPPKQEALAYVEGRTATPPARYARVTVVRGSLARPDVMEYRVGPIHGCDAGDCSAASVEAGSPLVPLLSDGAVSFEKRPIDVSDPTPFAQYAPLLLSLKSLLLESFGPVFDETLMPGCGTKCFSGADGLLTPFAFNDIASTAQARQDPTRPHPAPSTCSPTPHDRRPRHLATHLSPRHLSPSPLSPTARPTARPTDPRPAAASRPLPRRRRESLRCNSSGTRTRPTCRPAGYTDSRSRFASSSAVPRRC